MKTNHNTIKMIFFAGASATGTALVTVLLLSMILESSIPLTLTRCVSAVGWVVLWMIGALFGSWYLVEDEGAIVVKRLGKYRSQERVKVTLNLKILPRNLGNRVASLRAEWPSLERLDLAMESVYIVGNAPLVANIFEVLRKEVVIKRAFVEDSRSQFGQLNLAN